MSKTTIKNLKKIYNRGQQNEVRALDGVDFELNQGEFTVILGASGSGKSTALNILGGMDSSTEGEYIVDDQVVSSFTEKQLTDFRRYDVGFVFQFYNLVPTLTALENVALAQTVARDPFDAADILEKVGLKERAGNFPSQLSGGEQQRTAIARALVKKPKLLLCDEPTGALDSKTGAQIVSLLYDVCHTYNLTVVVVTHNTKLADCAEHLIKLADGAIIEDTHNDNPLPPQEIKW